MDDHGADIPEQRRSGPWGAAVPQPDSDQLVTPARPTRRPRHSWVASMLVATLALAVGFVITVVLGVAWITFRLPGPDIVGWGFPAFSALAAVRLTLWLKR